MKRVVIESPYAGKSTLPWPLSIIGKWLDRRENERYLKACIRDSFLEHGEAPFASHGLYPGALDDDAPTERSLGINAGFVWGDLASLRVVYTDRGMSFGMKLGIERAKMINQRVEHRTVPGWNAKRKRLPKL